MTKKAFQYRMKMTREKLLAQYLRLKELQGETAQFLPEYQVGASQEEKEVLSMMLELLDAMSSLEKSQKETV